MVKAFLSHTPQEAFADRIGSGSVIRRFENLDTTCPRHPSKAGPKFAVVIPNQVLGCVPIGGRFSQLLCDPQSGRKKRSVTWRKSHAQICEEWLRRNVLHFCPRGCWVRTPRMYFWMVRLHTGMPSFNSSPRMRSAPQSRLSFAICLIKAIVSAATFG